MCKGQRPVTSSGESSPSLRMSSREAHSQSDMNPRLSSFQAPPSAPFPPNLPPTTKAQARQLLSLSSSFKFLVPVFSSPVCDLLPISNICSSFEILRFPISPHNMWPGTFLKNFIFLCLISSFRSAWYVRMSVRIHGLSWLTWTSYLYILSIDTEINFISSEFSSWKLGASGMYHVVVL